MQSKNLFSKRLPGILTVALLSLASVSTIAAATNEPYNLFESIPPGNDVIARQPLPHISRDATIQINPDYYGNKKLALDLFGQTVIAVRDRVAENVKNSAVWVGKIQGDTASSVVLTKRGNSITGSIRYQGKLFEINTTPQATAVLQEINESNLPRDQHKQAPFPPPTMRADQSPKMAAIAVNGAIVDLLVTYTPASCNAYGRDANGGCANLEAKIIGAVSAANTAYNNSQVNMQLNLVGMQEIAYTETGDMGLSLDRLTDTSDGFMDNVHTLRNTYGADQVALITQDTNACGIAWVMQSESLGFADYAFSVVYSSCLSSQTLAHELGHNQGNQHDPDSAGFPGAAPYAYGHRICATGGFRTVMAYSCTGAGRIDYFSNPNVLWNGVPTGIAEQRDNARSMNETADTVAAWRAGAVAPPAAPTALSASFTTPDQVKLSWQDNASNETGFRIERSTDTLNWTEIASVGANITQYSDNGMVQDTDTIYYYRVRSYNSSGNSTYSNTADILVPGMTLPAAPSDLSATASSESQINLSWTDNAGNEDGYKIERCQNAACTAFTQIATVGANVTSFSNTGLAASTAYSYKIRAFNARGNSAYSNIASATTQAVQPPTPPSNLTVTAISNAQINLNWTDNASNETGFKIERCKGMDCTTFTQIATVGANVTTYANMALSANTVYTYRVRAYHTTNGNSSYSNSANTMTFGPPSAPTGLTATAISTTQANLNWTDTSANESGFQLERCQGSSCNAFVLVTTTGANVTTYSDNGLNPGTVYRYRLRASNTYGTSSYTTIATITTPPIAPTNLMAQTLSQSQVKLTWTDNAANESGYKIERCSGTDCTTFAQIATVGANVVTYTSTSLTADTVYQYRVRAVTGTANSDYSNTVSATTLPAIPAAPSNLIATAVSSTQLTLNWMDNATNETGYKIERCQGSSSCTNFAEIGTVGANTTTYVSTGLSAKTYYRHRVRAYNLGVNSAYSNISTTKTP